MLRKLICHFIIKISKAENRSVTLKHSILIKNKYIIDLMHKKKKRKTTYSLELINSIKSSKIS